MASLNERAGRLRGSFLPELDELDRKQILEDAVGARLPRISVPDIDLVPDKAPIQDDYETITESPEPLPIEKPTPTPVSGPKLPDLEEARRAADFLRMGQGFTNAGERIGTAISGTKPEYTSNLSKQADIVEGRPMQDIQLMSVWEKMNRDKTLQDPNSKENIAYREQVRQLYPAFAQKMGPEFESITKPNLEKLLGVEGRVQDRMIRERTAEENANLREATLDATIANNETSREIQLATLANTNAYQGAQLAIQKLLAMRGLENDEERRRLGLDNRKMNRIDKLGQITREYFATPYSALLSIENISPGLSRGQVDPNSPIASFMTRVRDRVLPNAWSDPNMVQLRLNIENLSRELLKAQTGLAANNAELTAAAQQLNSSLTSSPENIAKALNKARQALFNQMRSTQSTFAAGEAPVLTDYEGLGNLTFNSDLFRDLNQTSANQATPIQQQTTQTAQPSEHPVLPQGWGSQGYKVQSVVNSRTGEVVRTIYVYPDGRKVEVNGPSPYRKQ